MQNSQLILTRLLSGPGRFPQRRSVSTSRSSVGSRTGAPTSGAGGCSSVFALAAVRLPSSRFQPPPRRTERADFPHSALLRASHQGLWDLSSWERFRRGTAPDPVAIEQPQRLVQPLPTPPRPAEAPALPGSQHVSPDLLFHPVLDEVEAPTGVTHREVVHPAPQDRVDQFDDPVHRLGVEATEDVPKLAQQRRALLELGRELRPPCTAECANTTEVEPQESEAFASVRSTVVLLSSLTSTCSLASSCRSRMAPPASAMHVADARPRGSPGHLRSARIPRRHTARSAWRPSPAPASGPPRSGRCC